MTHDGGVTELLLFERKQDAKTTNFGWELVQALPQGTQAGTDRDTLITSLVISILRLGLSHWACSP